MRAKLVLLAAVLAVACMEKPAPWQPGDVAGEEEAAESDDEEGGEDAAEGPSCHQALQCLVDMKNWKPGMPADPAVCVEEISETESDQAGALLECVEEKCGLEFDAWDESEREGDLSALYGCMIERCAVPITVCVGGEGKKTCLNVLICLAACDDPLDVDCNLGCLKQADDTQAQKVGEAVQCAMDECGGIKGLADC